MSPPVIAIIATLILGGMIYAFGYARAVMHRANSDYKKTKAALPLLRKDYWRALGVVIKFGVIVAIGYLVVAAWSIADAKGKK